MPFFCLGQNSKTSDTKVLPTVGANNQPVPQPIGGDDNWKLYINGMGIGLVYGNVCNEEFPFIVPMVVNAFEFGGDSIPQDCFGVIEYPYNSLHKKFLGSKRVLRQAYMFCYISHRTFWGEYC